MKKVYLASGWFNENQERRVTQAEKVLRGLGFDVFSPREHQHTEFEFGTKGWRKATFNGDIKHVDWCDIIFAIYDEEDAGTMWEIGYAFATGKPIIIFHETDSRLNLMISDSLRAHLTTFEEVKAYDFEQLPEIPYEGDVF